MSVEDLDGDVECGMRNALRNEEGRAFIAYVLDQLGYHKAAGHEVGFLLVETLDQVDPRGVMSMLKEHFLKGPQS